MKILSKEWYEKIIEITDEGIETDYYYDDVTLWCAAKIVMEKKKNEFNFDELVILANNHPSSMEKSIESLIKADLIKPADNLRGIVGKRYRFVEKGVNEYDRYTSY